MYFRHAFEKEHPLHAQGASGTTTFLSSKALNRVISSHRRTVVLLSAPDNNIALLTILPKGSKPVSQALRYEANGILGLSDHVVSDVEQKEARGWWKKLLG